MSEKLFVLQDSRSFNGNFLYFWKKNGGYTSDLNEAELFSEKDAVAQNQCRETDVPWPIDYLQSKIKSCIDSQYINSNSALEGTGITLKKPDKPPKGERIKCEGCGVFITSFGQFTPCGRCGYDNRP